MLGALFFPTAGGTSHESDPKCAALSFIALLFRNIAVGVVASCLSEARAWQLWRWKSYYRLYATPLLSYSSFCVLFICIFLAGASTKSGLDWIMSMGIVLIRDLLVTPMVVSFALAVLTLGTAP